MQRDRISDRLAQHNQVAQQDRPTGSHQFIPPAISDDASMYVVISIDGNRLDQLSSAALALRFTNRPCPTLPTNFPPSTTSAPRDQTFAALPFTFHPSNIE